MKHVVVLTVALVVALSGCAPESREKAGAETPPGPTEPATPPASPANVVTTEIQAGIERHVEEEVARGGATSCSRTRERRSA